MKSVSDTSAQATVSHNEKRPRPYGGLSAQERLQHRRARFVQAGIQVFGVRGVAGATIRDLCNEAGFTDRYFYESFRHVEDAFAATYEAVTSDLVVALAASLQGTHGDIKEWAENGLRAFYGFLKEDARRARILLVEAQIFYYSDKLRSTIRDEPYIEILGPVLRQRYPGIKGQSLNIDFIIKTLLGTVISTGAIWHQDGMKMSVDDVVRHQLFIWQGLDGWLVKVADQKSS